MLIEMVPLIVVLFELSIVLAALFGRPRDEPAPAEPRRRGTRVGRAPSPSAQTLNAFRPKGQAQAPRAGRVPVSRRSCSAAAWSCSGRQQRQRRPDRRHQGQRQRSTRSAFEKQVGARRAATHGQAQERAGMARTWSGPNSTSRLAGDGSDARPAQLTDREARRSRAATQAWERYLTLKPKKPDAAHGAVRRARYGALQDYGKAVETQVDREGAAERERLFPARGLRLPRGQVKTGDRPPRSRSALTPKDQRNTVSSLRLKESRASRARRSKKAVKKAEQQAAEGRRRAAARAGQASPSGPPPGQRRGAASP